MWPMAILNVQRLENGGGLIQPQLLTAFANVTAIDDGVRFRVSVAP